MVFLIDYQRRLGKAKIKRFENRDRAQAQLERLSIELSDKTAVASGKREVVILEAQDERTLHRTHRRYFKSVKQILDSVDGIVKKKTAVH